ncbi:MAG: hypothetical protein HYY02_07110 [Chloroflexi bacterium]|nr:hypothetical protein [Chloroflexota bacterium]
MGTFTGRTGIDPVLYRSADGIAWARINDPTNGWVAGKNYGVNPMVVGEKLYVGTFNLEGAQVWRTPYDGEAWEKVLDFAAIDSTVRLVTYIWSWRGTIYVGTWDGVQAIERVLPQGAHIYTSSSGDPGTWTKNAGVGDGFGDRENRNIAQMVDFEGFLYASTSNRQGGQLWRSQDGQAWQRVVDGGFGNPLNNELHSLRVINGQLWVATLALQPHSTEVWRSNDGSSFLRSNEPGWGIPENRGNAGIAVQFGDFVFAATPNATTGGQLWRAVPPPPPPELLAPSGSVALATTGTTLSWSESPRATQVHLQVVPANNDGPAIDAIRSAESSFLIQPPVIGQGNYTLLPDMTYTWRVRASNKPTYAPTDDRSWGPWSEARTFRTPVRDSSRIAPVSPANGATIGKGIQALQWDNQDRDVFYYEVQVSPDPKFGEEGPVAPVWHNLVHGGVSTPLNSWRTPELQPSTTYYWRVRPRVQGDGIPVAWSQTWSFSTAP